MTIHNVPDAELGRDLILEPDIPGQIGWEGLIGLARLATQVPEHGVIVETGSLFGRSSFIWSKNSHPSTEIFCIDPWVREDWIVEIVEKPQPLAIPFSIEAHEHYTSDCGNITRIQGYSPDVVADTWDRQIDLYFDDSDHNQPVLGRNFDYWIDWVKPGGIVCGDEFSPEFPEVLAEIEAMANLWSTEVESQGLVWWMHKPIDAPSARQRKTETVTTIPVPRRRRSLGDRMRGWLPTRRVRDS